MSPVQHLDLALAGCTIVVVADRRAGDLASALERHGATAYRAPALSIVPNADDEELMRRTAEVIADPPDIIVVTTGVGFRGWMDAADEHGLAEDLHAALSHTLFIARGPKAHGAIQQAGFVADWVAETETAAEVGEYLLTMSIAGMRIAVQHHGSGADGLDALLTSRGADVTTLVVYRWGPPPDRRVVDRSVAQAVSGEVDGVLFTSAPGAAAWLRVAEELSASAAIRDRAVRGRLLLGAVGPITATVLEDAGLRTTVADRGRLGSLARCAIGYFSEQGSAPSLPTRAGRVSMRSRGVVVAGTFIPLSRTAAGALSALFDARGGVLSRDEIAAASVRAGRGAHAVEMAVARLRESLRGIDIVQTVVKRGYRLAVEEPR